MGYFSRFLVQVHFWHRLPATGNKSILQYLVQGRQLSPGIFDDLLLGRKGRSESLSYTCYFSSASK